MDSKENEIVAIPKLLSTLSLEGAVVTIDAIGCQKEIARAIRAAKAHYLLPLKDNQPTMHAEVLMFMEDLVASGAKERRWPHRGVRMTPSSCRPRLGRGANPGTCPQGDRRAGMAVWWKSRSPIPLFKDPLRKFFMRQPCFWSAGALHFRPEI